MLTKAKFEINRKELSAIASNENVEIKATLITNGEKYDLYKNPLMLDIMRLGKYHH